MKILAGGLLVPTSNRQIMINSFYLLMTGWPLGSFQLRTSLTTTVLLLRGRGNQFLWDPSRSVPFSNTWISVTIILAVKLNQILLSTSHNHQVPLSDYPLHAPAASTQTRLLLFKSCPALCDSTDCSTPGFPLFHWLPEFAPIHVHWVSDAIQPSHPLLPPFPPGLSISQSFPISQLFTSGGQSIGASASVLPMNNQGWFPLGLTSLISLQPKGLWPGIISNTSDSGQRGLGPWKLFASYFLPADLYGRP